MKLEEIGFYTLTDNRCKNASKDSDIMRAEIILTDICNFSCIYCRGMGEDLRGTLSSQSVYDILYLLNENRIRNIRFSGGEPTLHKDLKQFVNYCKSIPTIEHIAISTNGSADLELYLGLIDEGVNDMSISLDACCSQTVDKMAGVPGYFDKVIDNIKEISKRIYVTVGVVLTEDNLESFKDTVLFAMELGVADIRIISAAQYNRLPNIQLDIPKDKYPILRYRLNNSLDTVRGLTEKDSMNCGLVLDDVAIAGNHHFPCIIYLREGGEPIGRITDTIREDRYNWYREHNCLSDPICKKNCLDVCREYNNRYARR